MTFISPNFFIITNRNTSVEKYMSDLMENLSDKYFTFCNMDIHLILILLINSLNFFLYFLLGTLYEYLCIDIPSQLSKTFNSLVYKICDDSQGYNEG